MKRLPVALLLATSCSLAAGAEAKQSTLLIGVGDSLTHGNMDGTNNTTNTLNAYLQKVADSLRLVTPLKFSQPLFDDAQTRLMPFRIPTNLGVDGADSFSLEGISYGKRAGVAESFVTRDLLCDRLLPSGFKDKYDKVLYPINLLARQPVSQVDSAIWLLNRRAETTPRQRALVVLWIGSNDASTAALGAGGDNPIFEPIPLDAIETEITPVLRLLLRFGQSRRLVSFDSYTPSTIARNLTEPDDFSRQYEHLLARLRTDVDPAGGPFELFLLTVPYYSSVAYLFDSEDLEYYLRKLDPSYSVPDSFARVAPPGEPVLDFLRGDRVALLTFGFMYGLLSTGHSVEEINAVLERGGVQRDDLVLSEEEQAAIRARIDAFNSVIGAAAAGGGPHVHLVDIGGFLNDALTGKISVSVGGRVLSRKWVRGGGFSFDGVHPGYTGHALIANFILARINEALHLDAPLHDLSEVLAGDPYIDRDGDGWAPGPHLTAPGFTELLYLFKDPDDTDPAVGPELPPDVWEKISDVLLREILGIPQIAEEARSLSVAP